MSAYSTDEQRKIKAQKLDEHRSYHQSLISNLGIIRSEFQFKRAFYDRHGRKVVGIFASEFRKDKGFYFELIDHNLDPVDDGRTVYHIPNNPYFETEYEASERNNDSYLVPVDELRMVNPTSVAISGPTAVVGKPVPSRSFSSSPSAQQSSLFKEDAPYSEMSIRDYYAIHSGKPVSLKTWLNELIKMNN